ncbi:hypothetical protein [Streptomyces sp. NPDC059916]|uniref:hypothetical protein n=1 Tax=Streptomyces sp. NPDC059916 TaxID=3347001 RepID=UPI0036D05075
MPPQPGMPLITNGLRTVNFFNGRLLTAEDLHNEQISAQRARRRLGLAVGDGVLRGLRVRVSATATRTRLLVHVESGIAVNMLGDPLELGSDVDVSLSGGHAPAAPVQPATFAPCGEPDLGAPPLGAGAYLLTLGPASQKVGRAPVNGQAAEPARCATDATVEGVTFGLLPLDVPASFLGAKERPRLRNRLAHLLFGSTGGSGRPGIDLLGADGEMRPPQGLVDELRTAGRLDDASVPLAAVFWTVENGVEFVDTWAARRGLVRREPAIRWPALLGERPRSDAVAVLHQFQDQVDDLVASDADLTRLAASDLFDLLPPAGIVPVASERSGAGFHRDDFLGAVGSRFVETLDGDAVRALLEESLTHRPVPTTGGDLRFRRYWVSENLVTSAEGSVPRLVMVFAAESLAYRGTARFGYARMGASRFAHTGM